MQPDLLDEAELRLVHALQVAPRISWTDLARVLGVSAQAEAARWQRLQSEGLAWVAAYPGGRFDSFVFALVEVDCRSKMLRSLTTRLCQDPRVVTVEEPTRGRDLLLTVMSPDLAALSTFVLDELTALPGVERQRTYVMTSVHRDGSRWTLDALSRDETRQLRDTTTPIAFEPAEPVPAGAGPLLAALVRDGRAPAADLARSLGRDPSTARRQLTRLLRSGAISLRCEVANSAVGYPISFLWLARVAAADVHRTVTALATLPELRLCASTTGATNLVIAVWARDLRQVETIEQTIGELAPWIEIRDSGLNLRTPKRVGWLLDDQGRSTGSVIPPSALAHL